MTLDTYDSFQLHAGNPKLITASVDHPAKITNARGGAMFINTSAHVNARDAEIPVGQSFEANIDTWIASATESAVIVEHP